MLKVTLQTTHVDFNCKKVKNQQMGSALFDVEVNVMKRSQDLHFMESTKYV